MCVHEAKSLGRRQFINAQLASLPRCPHSRPTPPRPCAEMPLRYIQYAIFGYCSIPFARPCDSGENDCLANATCIHMGPNWHSCACPRGFEGDGSINGTGCNAVHTGPVYGIGRNNAGMLGLGDTSNRNSPTHISELGSDNTQIAVGWHHTMVLKLSPENIEEDCDWVIGCI
eukprot:SAG22_NODE_335_length_12071_cov_5.268771_6_plen_172_part_00